MTTPLLTTKLHIPPVRRNLVPRPRLPEQLNDGLRSGRKLTLISVPAGFGKTSLVSEWVDNLQLDTAVKNQIIHRIAWLSLDASDNDPTRFMAYLVAALQAIEGHLVKD